MPEATRLSATATAAPTLRTRQRRDRTVTRPGASRTGGRPGVTEQDTVGLRCSRITDYARHWPNEANIGMSPSWGDEARWSKTINTRDKRDGTAMRDFFYPDKIVLKKSDGKEHKDIRAQVNRDRILTEDANVPIDPGDTIARDLPNGSVERYVVTSAHFHNTGKRSRFKDYYEVKCRKEGDERQTSPVNVRVVGSPQAHVNVQAIDNSVSIIDGVEDDVFEVARELLRKNVDDSELGLLIARVNELERTKGTQKYRDAYKELIAVAANHLTILSPILPSLASML